MKGLWYMKVAFFDCLYCEDYMKEINLEMELLDEEELYTQKLNAVSDNLNLNEDVLNILKIIQQLSNAKLEISKNAQSLITNILKF